MASLVLLSCKYSYSFTIHSAYSATIIICSSTESTSLAISPLRFRKFQSNTAYLLVSYKSTPPQMSWQNVSLVTFLFPNMLIRCLYSFARPDSSIFIIKLCTLCLYITFLNTSSLSSECNISPTCYDANAYSSSSNTFSFNVLKRLTMWLSCNGFNSCQ